MKGFFKKNALLSSLTNSFVNLLFPPLCLHCRQDLESDSPLFCQACTENLLLIDPAERCSRCFSEHNTTNRQLCQTCKRTTPILSGIASAFDYEGPPATLIKRFKYANQPFLAKGAAAFLTAQFLRLEWPMPDVIIPTPMAFTHWLDRGYNQSQLLADEVGLLLDRPVQKALQRHSGDYRQADLNKKQRQQLTGHSLQVKADQNLHDKCLLLIDDVLTTGSTLRRCAEALWSECPSSIYGLTVCHSLVHDD